jgi:hypothetical protein
MRMSAVNNIESQDFDFSVNGQHILLQALCPPLA